MAKRIYYRTRQRNSPFRVSFLRSLESGFREMKKAILFLLNRSVLAVLLKPLSRQSGILRQGRISRRGRKAVSLTLAFLIVFQTIIGVFAPVDFSLDPPYLESQNAEAASWYGTAGWGYRKKIAIDNTKVPNTDQANFPVLVNRLDDDWKDTGSGGNVGQADGGDFLFTSSDGQTKLSHEIEKYTNTTGELIAWVRIPTLSASADTEIYLYYGNASCDDQWDTPDGVDDVWDSNFKMVQHMNEDPSGGAPQMIDSTNNSNDGTSGGTMLTEDQVAGQIDGSLDFDGSNDYVDAGNGASLDFGTGDFSVTSWIKTTWADVNSDKGMYITKSSGLNELRFGLSYSNTNKGMRVILDDGSTEINKDKGTGTANINDGNWHYLAWTVDRNTNNQVNFMLDGISLGTTDISSLTGNLDNVDNWNIGRFGGSYLLGTIDEVRVSSTARSADWIATEYNNQSDPSTFYEIGIQEVASPTALTSWLYRKAITIDESKIPDTLATDLVDFPVLINLTSDDNLAANTQADFDDILFTSSATAWDTGTENDKLAHEIESYNSTTGELQAWVNIPVLDYNDDTVIYMYYGNGSTASQQNMEEVWDGNTKLVQHLQESPANDAAGHLDSTNNSNDGTPKNFNSIATSTTDGTGQIDGADVFDGTDDYVDAGTSISIDTMIDGGNISGSMWVKSGDTTQTDAVLLNFYVNADNRHYIRIDEETGNLRIYQNINAAGSGQTTTGNYFTDTDWHHLVWVTEGVSNKIYIDGNYKETLTLNNSTSGIVGSVNTFIGTASGGASPFNGTIDEVRISSTARSADWIATEYNNQSDPSTFYEIGIQEVASPTALTSWLYRKAITIDNDKVSGSADITNFPVLINLTSDDDLASHAQADFDDILFTSSATAWDTGTENDKLAHEIESYNSTTGELQAWVNVPVLDYDDDTVIYMYYGNGSTASQQNMEEVWDGNTKLVQHLEETGANPQVVDSTNNSNDSTTNLSDPTTGQVDGAMEFNGTDDYVDCGDDTSLDNENATIEAWVKSLSNTNDMRIFINHIDSTDNIGMIMSSGHIVVFTKKSDITDEGRSVDTYNDGNWHHIVFIRNGDSISNAKLYVDGIEVSIVDGGDSWSMIGNAKIGAKSSLQYFYDGTIDEVRISSTARSADWIATEYNNQSDPSNFYDLGVEDTCNMDHFTITGSASQTAGVAQEITITAKDSGGNTITAYSGDKVLSFSGANDAPDATVPTFSDKDSADINLGSDTTLTFTNGVATSSMKLYKTESAEIEVDDTLYNSTGSADYDLNVTVAGATLDNFLVEAPATATSGIEFETIITSRDEFNNTTMDVSSDTTIAVDQGNLDTTNLVQAEFTDDGSWTGNLTITNITEQPAVSLSAMNGTPTGNDSITVLGIPADPTGCSASRISDTNFTVSWSDNSTVETDYKIQRKTDGGEWSEIATDTDDSPGDNDDYSDTTTLADHKYEYRVLGHNSVGNSVAYATDLVEHYTTPDTPSNVAGAYVSDGEFTITYTDNAEVEDTHRIKRCSNGNCDEIFETNLATFESSPQTDTTNLAVNSRYRWRARSETPDALASNYGISTYNYTTPTAPTIGTPAYVDDTHITVNWSDTSAYEDGFRVWVSVDGGAYAEVTAGVNTVGAGIETYSYTSSANHSYKFKITSHSPNDLISAESAESETVYTTPAAPTIGTPAWVSDNEITVNWTDNSDYEDGFRVWVSKDGGAFTEATPGVNSTTTDIQIYSYHRRLFEP